MNCDEQDACECQFWHGHIDWLINEEFINLKAAFRSILIMENAIAGKNKYLVFYSSNSFTLIESYCFLRKLL
jgi:hypothetical protein